MIKMPLFNHIPNITKNLQSGSIFDQRCHEVKALDLLSLNQSHHMIHMMILIIIRLIHIFLWDEGLSELSIEVIHLLDWDVEAKIAIQQGYGLNASS